MRRCLLLCLALLAAAPSVAHAALSDPIVPYVDEDDGVRIVERPNGGLSARFGGEAADVYRRLAGRKVSDTCWFAGRDGESGTILGHFRAPVERRRLRILAATDLCWWSTRRRPGERTGCLPDGSRHRCVRAIVALTDAGRMRVDEVARGWDLLLAYSAAATTGDGSRRPSYAELEPLLGSDLVELPARDASPPPGKVGYWTDGQAIVVATLTAAGVRRFFEQDGDVRSSNALGLVEISGPSLP